MDDRRHTFVVPAYGNSPYLRACLVSLRNQTCQSEVVIATSTPSRGIAALADEFGARLAVNSRGGSIGRDWNFALSQAQTPWVTLAHQDDVYLPKFVDVVLAAVEANPATTLVFTDYAELLNEVRRPIGLMLGIKRALLELGFLGRSSLSRNSAKRRLLRLGCPIPCPAVTLRAIPPMRFREDLKVNLDWHAWTQLAEEPGAFSYVRSVQMLHRIHGASETSVGVREGIRAAEDLMMFNRFWPAPVARILCRLYALSYKAG